MKRRRRATLLTLCLLLAGLTIACVLWVRAQQRQYVLNRRLIAVLVNEDDRQALALVNAGADPNTRYEATTAPTLSELVRKFFHRSPLPGNDSPTAFMMACGAAWLRNGQSTTGISSTDAPQLVQTMLSHGVDLTLKADGDWTPLDGALFADHKETVRLLLAKGTWNLNAQVDPGNLLSFTILYSHDKELVRQLLLHGANPNLTSPGRLTPLQFAKGFGDLDIVALLEQYGAKESKHP